jgi:hypothetical protein
MDCGTNEYQGAYDDVKNSYDDARDWVDDKKDQAQVRFQIIRSMQAVPSIT